MNSPEPMRTAFHEALMSLTDLSIVIPPHRRASLFQDVLSFRPANDLATEFAMGSLRAALAEVWESRFGTAVPVQKLRKLLTPPVAIGRVLEFTKLGIARDFDELADSLHQLLTHLADEVSKLSSSTQRLLFTDESADRHGGPTNVIGGRTVTSLAELVDQRVTFPTVYADPPWQYDNESARGAAARHYATMSIEEICAEPIRRQVRECIEMLPDPHRTVLLMRDIEEFDTATTAELLGVSVAEVMTRLHRGRQALRTLLEPLFVENQD